MSNQTWEKIEKIEGREKRRLITFSVSDFGVVCVEARLWYTILEALGFKAVEGEE